MIDRVLFALGFIYFLVIPFTNASFFGAIGLGLVARGIWYLIVRRHRAQIATPAFAKSLDYVTIAQRGPSPCRERQRSPVIGIMHTVPMRSRSAKSLGMRDAVPPRRTPSADIVGSGHTTKPVAQRTMVLDRDKEDAALALVSLYRISRRAAIGSLERTNWAGYPDTTAMVAAALAAHQRTHSDD